MHRIFAKAGVLTPAPGSISATAGSFAGALKEISVTFSEELLKTEQAPDHFQSKA